MLDYSLTGGILVSHGKKERTGNLCISGVHIGSGAGSLSVALGEKSCVYPALINTHDHMQGNYLPPVGPRPGTNYLTWLPWDIDLKESDTFMERSRLTREELYALSGYKCIFSGVATVNDHFPHKLNCNIIPTLPVRVITQYSIAHECSSYDLRWGDGIETEHDRAATNNWPFITHLCEGFDSEAMHGVDALLNLKILDRHCLLIHCISFSDDDIAKTAKAKASIAWCARSNMFMFNVTAKIRKMIKAGINITIGTDSSATGSSNLFEELRYDRELYRLMYGEDLSPRLMFDMVTHNAARAFWMQDKIGALDAGMLADILVLKKNNDDPYENLINASMADVELLTLEGNPLFGEVRFLDIFNGELPAGYTQINVGGRDMFIKGDPAGLYAKVRQKAGYKKILDFLPFDPE